MLYTRQERQNRGPSLTEHVIDMCRPCHTHYLADRRHVAGIDTGGGECKDVVPQESSVLKD